MDAKKNDQTIASGSTAARQLNLIGYMLGKMILGNDTLTDFMLQKMLNQLDFSSTLSNLGLINDMNSDKSGEIGEESAENMLVFKD